MLWTYLFIVEPLVLPIGLLILFINKKNLTPRMNFKKLQLMGNPCNCHKCCQRQVAFQEKYITVEYKSFIGLMEYPEIDQPYNQSKYYYFKINQECKF